MGGRSGGLLPGGTVVHSVWLRDLANIVVGIRHSRWCPVHVESVQASLNTTEDTRQQCGVSLGRQPTNDLTSPPPSVDLWRQGRDAECLWSGVEMPGQAVWDLASGVGTDV